MKKTLFYDKHIECGAKMVPFAGYDMPIQYRNGIIHEHKTVRENVGVFDVTHMGEFKVSGNDALAFIQKVTINDASKLSPGKAQYSAMCYNDGGIVDDLIVYLMDGYYMLVVNAANIAKNLDWLRGNTAEFDVELNDISDEINLLAVQGPKSKDTLKKICNINLDDIQFYNYANGQIAGFDAIISRTGYTGELGFEIYFSGGKETAGKIWDAIFDAGNEFGIEPIGLAARDTLRLEKGYCLYGNDIDQNTNPIEAGLGWITKTDKGNFNGSEVIVQVRENKPKRRLVGFVMNTDKFIPRKGYKISIDGGQIGFVTSGNLSPMLNKPIGMGYVNWNSRQPGTQIDIEARGRTFSAEIMKLPFV